MGGRQTCLAPRFGDQFDHQAVVFEYEDGVRVFGYTRDQEECHTDTSDLILGTKGGATSSSTRSKASRLGATRDRGRTMYDVEHRALFDGIRAGKARQQRELHVPQLRAGDHGPDRLLHRANGHLGRTDAVEAVVCAAAIRLECPASRQTRPDGLYATACREPPSASLVDVKKEASSMRNFG